MGWAEIKKRYEAGGLSATQSTEDMVARRILRSLGVTEGNLPKVERTLGLDVGRQDDTTLYERAVRLAEHYDYSVRFPPVRDVRSVKDAEGILIEMSEGVTGPGSNALTYRIKDTGDVRVMICKHNVDALYTANLVYPCLVRKSRDGSVIILDCDAQDYFDKLLRKKGDDDGSAY